MDITGEKIVAKVREIAAERPHFTYSDQPERDGVEGDEQACSYVSALIRVGGGEGCIVGQALAALGMDMDAVKAWEEDVALDSGIANLMRVFEIPHTLDERLWLAAMQREQDQGSTWGQAAAKADDDLARVRAAQWVTT